MKGWLSKVNEVDSFCDWLISVVWVVTNHVSGDVNMHPMIIVVCISFLIRIRSIHFFLLLCSKTEQGLTWYGWLLLNCLLPILCCDLWLLVWSKGGRKVAANQLILSYCRKGIELWDILESLRKWYSDKSKAGGIDLFEQEQRVKRVTFWNEILILHLFLQYVKS